MAPAQLVELLVLGGTTPAFRAIQVVVPVGASGTGAGDAVTSAIRQAEPYYSGGTISTRLQRTPTRRWDAMSDLLTALPGGSRPFPTSVVGPAEPTDEMREEYRFAFGSHAVLVVLWGVESEADAAPFMPIDPRSCLLIVTTRLLQLDEDVPVVMLSGASPTAPRLLAGYAADTVDGEDQLGIGADAGSLASLIASRETVPPLSIGLFGDWGDGKSFFLRSIEREVDRLARLSAQAEAAGQPTAFCSQVRQIEFNAWHFADASLWASLVVRIWEGLADPGGNAPIAGQLASSKAALDELGEERRTSEQRRKELERELEELERVEAERFRELERETAKTDTQLVPALAEASRELDRHSGARGLLRALAGRLSRGGRRQLAGRAASLAAPVTGATLVAFFLIPELGALLGTAIALVAGGVGLWAVLRTPIADVHSLLSGERERREQLQREADAARDARQRKLEQEIDSITSRIGKAQAELDEARRKTAATDEAIYEIRSGRRPYKFVADRLASDDYSRHLGIMALIRRDFEELTRLIKESRQLGESSPAGDQVPQIDRVVLYIDDLDRCSAVRVIEVLEAVHMLLAFDLFTVVVAVDTRWLMNALAQHYRGELGAAGSNGGAALNGGAATPQNYLEKIFQIPFAMPSMGASGYGRLIDSVLGHDDEDLASSSTATPGTAGQPVSAGAPSPLGLTTGLPPLQDSDLNPERLRVTDDELAFARGLHPLLPTPRAAKRFANTYRLMRASLDRAQLDELTGTGGAGDGEHPIAQLLLAMVVGVRPADTVLRTILDGKDGALSSAIRTAATELTNPFDAAALLRLAAIVVELERGDEVPEEIEPFKRWVPRVARYSFTTVRARAGRPSLTT